MGVSKVWSSLRRLLSDERGATAIEYGLLCALIALVVIGAMTTLFSNIGGNFNKISSNLQSH